MSEVVEPNASEAVAYHKPGKCVGEVVRLYSIAKLIGVDVMPFLLVVGLR